MAADRRGKRLNGSSIEGFNSWDEYRNKKKKFQSPKGHSNLKSHIFLEWDGSRQKVVAKGEQIGLSKRDMRLFIDSAPPSHNILADVFTVPHDIFELANLKEVLSYATWKTRLSQNERKFLMQFLPRGLDTEEVVQELLDGNNLHFGNPFLEWGASVCSGNSHPDAIILQEQQLKAGRKAHYSEIQKYHNDMIEYLQKSKKSWESSKDPEKEVLPKIWRSRRDVVKRTSSPGNESGFHDLEENVAATSESSLVAEERAWSSDNQNSPVMMGGEAQIRIYEKGFTKEKSKKPMVSSHDAKPMQGDRLHKRNIHHSDGAKYMSYLKISKKQHQLVMSMKQSGKGIQSKSLNRVLGNLDDLHVQPYEEFVKEEEKKLQQHWSKLANEDLPAAYVNWREKLSQRHEMMKSLEHDMKDKLLEHDMKDKLLEHDMKDKLESPIQDEDKEDHEFLDQNEQEANEYESNEEDEEKANHEILLQDQNDEGSSIQESDVEDGEDSGVGCPDHHSPQQISLNSSGHDLNPMDMEAENNNVPSPQPISLNSGGHDLNPMDMEAENNNVPSPQQISLNSGGHDLNPMDMDTENDNVPSKSSDTSPNVSEYSGNANTDDVFISQGVPISSGGGVWSAVGMPHSYYDSATNHEYTSTNEMPLPHHANEEQGTHLIDLESDVHEDDTRKELLHGQSDGSFSSFPQHDRSGLLQSLFKGQETLSYHCEQKQPGLDFQSPNNMLMVDGQFTGHLQGQLQPSLPLDQGQKRHTEYYMQQNISEDIYSDGGGYIIPNRGHLPTVNMQGWPVNPVRMSAQLQPHLNNDGLLPRHWFPVEHQVRAGWTSSDAASVPSQTVGSNADQGLFSVLSQCNQLRSSVPLDSVGSTEQFMLPRSYGMVNVGPPRIGNTLPHAAHPLEYMNGRETAASLMPDDIRWMNLQQNSALHDAMGKPYLRSWNQ